MLGACENVHHLEEKSTLYVRHLSVVRKHGFEGHVLKPKGRSCNLRLYSEFPPLLCFSVISKLSKANLC